ncbi:hypothetical protein ACOSQ2_028423 [Xanthoceras sorbifolium]
MWSTTWAKHREIERQVEEEEEMAVSCSEIAAKYFVRCQQKVGLLLGQLNTEKWRDKVMKKKKQQEWQCHAVTGKRSQPLVKNQAAVKPATYSSRISTDLPLL